MGLLDRFRGEPRWKHTDAAVRAAAVHEIEDPAVLASVAQDDPDARVRRAAVRRLQDAEVLGNVADRDADESVRDEARTGLLEVATSRVAPPELARAALTRLADQRQIAGVARADVAEDLAVEALARIADQKVLGGVARHAHHASVRLQALERVSDEVELGTVAVKTEFKDAALAALGRIRDRATLETVAARARTKVAARRARSLLRGAEEPIDARRREEHRRAQLQICEAADALTRGPNPAEAVERLQRLEERWDALEQMPDEDLADRFDAARHRLRAAAARAEAERSERERRARDLAEGLARRVELCRLLETAAPANAPAVLEQARLSWVRLPVVHDPQAEAIERRFEEAARALQGRYESESAARASRARAEEIVGRIEELATGEQQGWHERWNALRSEWNHMPARPDDLLSRYETAAETLRSREAEARAARERQDRETLARVQQTAEQLERTAAVEGLTLKSANRALQTAKSAVEQALGLMSRREHQDLIDRLKGLQTRLAARAQELREADEWQRWANASVQEELCRQVEALRELDDPVRASRELREAHERWRTVAAAPREKAQALWMRFKTASDAVRATCDAHFAEQNAERARNLARKEALCEQAEALAESTDWVRTADEIKRLQAEWKTIGPALREKATWERFRKACDRFFSRRQEDLARRKEEWTRNFQHKQALIQEVEDLTTNPGEWETAVARVRQLQSEWRHTGPVRRRNAEDLWQRFVQTCDQFFRAYQQRDNAEHAAKMAQREAICAEVESLATADREDVATALQALRARWREAPPLPREQAAPLSARFDRAVGVVVQARPEAFRGTDLDPERNRQQKESLIAKVERLISQGAPAQASPAALLASQLREALAANTIGGRVSDESKWRAAAEEVRNAQTAWKRIGPVPGDAGRVLTERFNRACSRFYDIQRRRLARGEEAKVKS